MTELSTTADRLLSEASALRALARSLVDPSQSDDLVQDAYVAALRQNVEGEQTGRWLNAVTRRLALLRRRREHRRQEREARVARAEATASAADVAATAELMRNVATAVHELEEPFRTAITLRFWQQLPPRTIAARLGVPTNTVRSRIQRGLARLRLRLDDDYGDRTRWAVPLCGFAQRTALGTGTFALGGLLMGIAAKVALVAGAVVLGWMLWSSGAPNAPVASSPSPDGGSELATLSTATVPPPDRRAFGGAEAESRDGTPLLVVTGTLVAEETLAPLAGVEVCLLNALHRDARVSTTEARAESTRDGGFRLEDARSDVAQYAELLIDAPDRATFRHSVPRADDPERTNTPRVIDVGRILVPPGTGVRGTVVDAAGVPVRDASVFVSTFCAYYQGISTHAADMLPFVLEFGRTDAAGWFTARRRIVPYGPETFVVAVADRGIGWTLIDAARHRRELDVVVRLRPSVQLDVDVRGTADAALTGASVRAEPRFSPLGHAGDGRIDLGNRPEVLSLFTAMTGAEGRATLPHLPPGEGADWGPPGDYDLVVEAVGYRTLRQPVTLAPPRESLTLRLVADLPIAVDVRVVDADRKPVAGARVSAGGDDATTGDDGCCHLDGAHVDEDALHFEVTAAGFLPLAESRPLSTDDVEFVLAKAAVLTGVVVDQHGQPVVGARVFVDGSHRADADAGGGFRVDASTAELVVMILPPDPREGWAQNQPKQVRATDGPLRWVLERLTRGIATLNVEVIDMVTGAPADLGSGTLYAVDASDMKSGPYLDAAERRIGQVRYTGLRPGRYKLTVGSAERLVEVAPEDIDVHLRVEVGAPGVLLGEVVFDGVPPKLMPATVEVAFGPSNLARWVEPPGGKLLLYNGLIVRAAELVPAVGTRFRLEGVVPHEPLELSVSGEGVVGRAVVRAVPASETRVVVHVGLAGGLLLRLVPRCPEPSIRLRFRGETGDWDAPRVLRVLGDRTSSPIWMRTGHYRWQVAWDEPAGERTIEGDVTIEPRRQAQVVVDFGAAKK